MTKLLLELGSDVNFVSHWDSDFHPGYPVCRGTAFDLALEMKVQKFDSIFASLKTVNTFLSNLFDKLEEFIVKSHTQQLFE